MQYPYKESRTMGCGVMLKLLIFLVCISVNVMSRVGTPTKHCWGEFHMLSTKNGWDHRITPNIMEKDSYTLVFILRAPSVVLLSAHTTDGWDAMTSSLHRAAVERTITWAHGAHLRDPLYIMVIIKWTHSPFLNDK